MDVICIEMYNKLLSSHTDCCVEVKCDLSY